MTHIAYSTPETYPHISALQPMDWMSSALCAQVDPDLFFGEKEGARWIARRAKSVCANCPVAAACLEFGMDDLSWGVYGGLTAHERRELRDAV
jgi:WhiB family transcriptional regulator, redox-sensing transcriptional regulator